MDEFVIRDLANNFGTPFYVISWPHIATTYFDAKRALSNLPVKHWLSLKTLPIKPLVSSWSRMGEGIEVVSEFECRAALSEQLPATKFSSTGLGKVRGSAK